MMGLTQHADRNFAYIIVSVLAYGAFGLLLMPMAYHIIGMNGVMTFFALFCLSGLFFVKQLPNSGEQNVHSLKNTVRYSPSLKTISLLAILFYNIAIGLVWAYIFLIGLEADIAEQSVANALTISQFLGIAGALLAVMLETRFGRAIPLVTGIAGSVAGVYLLIHVTGFSIYLIGVCLFNFLWNLSLPYLLAILADFDRTGKIVTQGVAMQMVGLAVGPYLAAEILGKAGYNGVAQGIIMSMRIGDSVKDLMDEYLEGCSPYIDSLVYDINKRELLLVCVNNPEDCLPRKSIIFKGIESYAEETIDTEYDDNCLDSVIGMPWINKDNFCIRTEKKEIIIKLSGEINAKNIA